MTARLAALALTGLLPLAACTGPAPEPAATPDAATAAPDTTTASATGTPTASPSGSATPTTGGQAPALPAVVVLSGTAIGNLPLGKAPAATVDPLIAKRLGKAKVGQPELCTSETERTPLATVVHSWPGFAVRYGSSGGAAVAIGWTVDLTDPPDGFDLDAQLPWRPTFAALKRGDGVVTGTEAGVRYAELPGERVTYSGPASAARPDTLTGGPRLTCG